MNAVPSNPALKAARLVAVAALVLLSPLLAQAQQGHGDDSHGHGPEWDIHSDPVIARQAEMLRNRIHGEHAHAMPIPVGYESLVEVADLVGEVRDIAPERWGDVERAKADGFRVTADRSFHHYINRAWMGGEILDPEQPESLIYYPNDEGELELIGVMFMTGRGEERPSEHWPLLMWHNHGQEGAWMLHIWLIDSPAGVFAEGVDVLPYLRRASR